MIRVRAIAAVASSGSSGSTRLVVAAEKHRSVSLVFYPQLCLWSYLWSKYHTPLDLVVVGRYGSLQPSPEGDGRQQYNDEENNVGD